MSSNVTTQFARDHGTLLLAVSMQPKEVGRKIAHAREQKGWTQLAFALHANVSPSTIQRWESGKLPPVRELMRISELLEIPTSELVEPEPIVDAARVAQIEREIGEVRRGLGDVDEIRKAVARIEALLRELGDGSRRRRSSA